MATLLIEETHESRGLNDGYEPNNRGIDLEFVCFYDDYSEIDPTVAETAVLAKCALAPYGDPLFGLRLQTAQMRAVTKFIYLASVHYGQFEPPKPTDHPSAPSFKIGFSTRGGTQKITHSLATVPKSPT